ncbi:MAG: AcrR family transcriptional regulator [Planctomycetota bacterium]|jgi:AcrR family transcriptional regulator
MPTSESPAPTAVRSAGRPRDRRAHHKILEATRSLATEQGYGGVTIEGVARAAGVAKTTIYRWWSSKSALVYEACFDPELRDPLPDTGSLKGDLEALVRQEVERQTGEVASRVLPGLIAEQAQAGGKASILDPILRPERKRAAAILERAARRGDLTGSQDGELLFDQVAGAVFHRTFVAGNPADTQFQADLARALLSGLKG